MSKQVQQFRYYNDKETVKNQPSKISYARLASGSIFFEDSTLGAITQLGIQSLPGTKFYLNNSAEPIIIGSTGIYELNLEGISEITALSFDTISLQNIQEVNNAYLIVDAIYNAEDD